MIPFRIQLVTASLLLSSTVVAQADESDFHTFELGAQHGEWVQNAPNPQDFILKITPHSVSNAYGLCGYGNGFGAAHAGVFATVFTSAYDQCATSGPLSAASVGGSKSAVCFTDSFDYTPGQPPGNLDQREWNPVGVASSDGEPSAQTEGSLGSGDATTVAVVKWVVDIQPLLGGAVEVQARSSGTNLSSTGVSITLAGVSVAIPYAGPGSLPPDSDATSLLRNPVDTNSVSRSVTTKITGYSFADGGWFGPAQCESGGDGRCWSDLYLTDRLQ